MFGLKKKDDLELEARISETAHKIALEALQDVVDTEIEDEEGNVDVVSTLEAIRQKTRIALDFIENLTTDSEKQPVKQEKDKRTYARK